MIRALIVEDDPVIGRAMGRSLSRHVTVVDVVANAATALHRLEIDAIDVVITDYDLGAGSVNGAVLAATIRERWPELPVIMASGSIDEEVRIAALASGVREFFLKPVPIDVLATALRRVAISR